VSLLGGFEPSVLECQLVLAAPEVAAPAEDALDNAVFPSLHAVKLLVGAKALESSRNDGTSKPSTPGPLHQGMARLPGAPPREVSWGPRSKEESKGVGWAEFAEDPTAGPQGASPGSRAHILMGIISPTTRMITT
jgi:hypothetical protein